MGRRYKGPVQLDRAGVWYAVYRPEPGKRLSKSLGTRNHHTAQLRYPAAFKALVAEARGLGASVATAGPRRGEVYEVWDVPRGMEPSIENLERYGISRQEKAEALFHPEELAISWKDAAALYRQRCLERKGKPPSDSWEKALIAALRVAGDTTPETITTADVRLMRDRLRDRGNSPTTIKNRLTILRTLVDVVIKSGMVGDDVSNPFERVDYSASSQEHHETALEADYRRLGEVIDGMSPVMRTSLLLLAYTGLRVRELTDRKPEDLVDGWLTITGAKTKSGNREVPIPAHLQQAFRSVKKWPSVGSILANTKKVRPELCTHSWRHGWKTAQRAAGADEHTGEVLLGHAVGSSISRVYGKWPREPLMETAEKVWKTIDEWVGMSGVETSITAVDHSGLR